MPNSKSTTQTPVKSRKPRVCRTPTQWQSLIDDCRESPLSQQAFCRQHQIAISSLHKWRKRFAAEKPNASFIEITQAPQPTLSKEHTQASGWQVELELSRGIVLRLKGI